MKTLQIKNWFYKYILTWFGWIFIHIICHTLKIQSIGENHIERLRKKGEKLVYTFWHGRHFFLVHYLGHRNISVMVSPSRDGMLIANILKKSGFDIVQGSSNRSPIRALVDAIRQMKSGKDIAFTVDGPKGPIHKVKPGALYLANRMNAYIIPVTTAFESSIKINSWDRYIIPKPFSKAIIYFGKPYRLSNEHSDSAIKKECFNLEKNLNNISSIADSFFIR
jgi:lysophospholipid acyltransferase (LPLAT)-like uncharacterized protein